MILFGAKITIAGMPKDEIKAKLHTALKEQVDKLEFTDTPLSGNNGTFKMDYYIINREDYKILQQVKSTKILLNE